MSALFADTFFFIALLVPQDKMHARANAIIDSFDSTIVTTTWVLFEVGDAMASPANRPAFGRLLDWLHNHPLIKILPPADEQFEQATSLFLQRHDKSWSLTDCASFHVMTDLGITEALTGDHHFEQAGFVALLK